MNSNILQRVQRYLEDKRIQLLRERKIELQEIEAEEADACCQRGLYSLLERIDAQLEVLDEVEEWLVGTE